MSTPMAMCAALGGTLPLSRALTLTASRYKTGQNSSSGRSCHSSTASLTASVMSDIVSGLRSAPIVFPRWCWMPRTVMPPAYRDMIISSSPPSLPERLGTNLGANEPSLSRGTCTAASPTGVDSVLGHEPLREFACPPPAFDPPVAGRVAQARRHLGPQAAFPGDPRELARQTAVAGELDPPAVYPFEQGIQRPRRDQRVHQGPRIRHGTIVIPGHIAGHRLHCLGHHDRFLSIR